MKLFNAIAAAAVISATCDFHKPARASILVNIDSNEITVSNDNDSELYLKKDGQTVRSNRAYKQYVIAEFVEGIKKRTGEYVTLGNPLRASKFEKNASVTEKMPSDIRPGAIDAFNHTIKSNMASSSGCPAGTSYHKIRVGGLIKRTAAEGCFTDFQASQLRMQANANQQQRLRDFQRNLNESFTSPVNCSGTVNNWGGGYNTYDATCY